MTTFKIATSTRGLATQLRSLYADENALRWQRAAIVYAYIESGRTTIGEFAGMKLAGLRSMNTVTSHRQAWKAAVAQGIAKHVEPGDEVAIPSADFQTYWDATSSGRRNESRRNTTPSIQGERQPKMTDRSKDWTASEPRPTRTASPRENVEAALQNIKRALAKEKDGNSIRVAQLQLSKVQLENTLAAYEKATSRS